MGWDGMGWDGMGWDGMGWGGVGWDGMGWDGTSRTSCSNTSWNVAARSRALSCHTVVLRQNARRVARPSKRGDRAPNHNPTPCIAYLCEAAAIVDRAAQRVRKRGAIEIEREALRHDVEVDDLHKVAHEYRAHCRPPLAPHSPCGTQRIGTGPRQPARSLASLAAPRAAYAMAVPANDTNVCIGTLRRSTTPTCSRTRSRAVGIAAHRAGWRCSRRDLGQQRREQIVSEPDRHGRVRLHEMDR